MDGLFSFCKQNQTIVNLIKTKIMIFGNFSQEPNVYFNGRPIEVVQCYKCLGNVVNTIKTSSGDLFKMNKEYLCNKARGAIFSLMKKTRCIAPLPPKCMFYMFEAMIEPILMYGSDVWGINSIIGDKSDKIMFSFIRNILHVKITTSNEISIGESGLIPVSVNANVNSLKYFVRRYNLPNNMPVKLVFNELQRLHELGYKNWYSKTLNLAEQYSIDLYEFNMNSVKHLKKRILNDFKSKWLESIHNNESSRIIKSYGLIKKRFGIEIYLNEIKEQKYRIALSRLRTSSHILEIERGRHAKPKISFDKRLCPKCNTIEDERHFVSDCKLYEQERNEMFSRIQNYYQYNINLELNLSYEELMCHEDPMVLNALGKYVYNAFKKRDQLIS